MFVNDEDDYSDEDKPAGFFGRISNSIKTFTGGKMLTESDLEPILE